MGVFGVLHTLFRVFALVQFLYAIYWDIHDNMPEHMKGEHYPPPGFGGRFRNLTMYGLVSNLLIVILY